MTGAAARDLIGYTVTLETDDPVLRRLWERAYAGFPAAADAEHRVVVARDPRDATRSVLRVDGVVVSAAETAGALVPALVAALNRRAAEASPHVLVHAGAVARKGAGLVLPAPMESGKTTLTAGLVRAGFRYLSDEAAVFERTTDRLLPYPKPLSIDRGAWPLFPELEPDEPFPDDAYKRTQWLVPAPDLGPDVIGEPCTADVVVFPTYVAGAPTALAPLRRADALVELAKNTFRFDEEGRPTFALLARVARRAEVYRLTVGDLEAAVEVVSALFDG